MRPISTLALVWLPLAATACVEIPDPPNITARLLDFEQPTGSVLDQLPAEIVSAFEPKRQSAGVVEAAGGSGLEASGNAIDEISLPVEGFVRFTRRCAGVEGESDAGELRGTVVIEKNRLPKAVALQAIGCRGELPGTQIDGELVVALAESTWALIDADVIATPLSAGALDESKATEARGAIRVCVSSAGGCSAGDVELSIGTSKGNLVAVVDRRRSLLGLRDRNGLWSCRAGANALAAECTHESSSVVLEGVNP